ncbi:MAG TPA: glycosyltransferase family 4 protein [Thermoleophilaceae bacterium]|nr:glycosyltransferase family 4 protein [Thermoleophilaceae bacterium]
MADLIVTPWTPGLGGGQRMRTYGIVRALAAHGPVDVLYPALDASEPSPEYRAIPGVAFHPVEPSRGLSRALAFGMTIARGVPPGFARGVSAEMLSAIEELAETPERGRVIADGPISSALTERLARKRPVIYNAHNLESAFRREAGAHGDPLSGWTLERFERRVLRHVAEAWMVSRKDMEGSLELAPDTPVKIVPNVVDVAAITPVAPAGQQRVLLVADYRWPPNTEGAGFLQESVLPLVWERLPQARLTLVGRGLPEGFAKDERIEVQGFVDDLADAYGSADCVVVPLLTGGGSPLKFVEALAFGLPVVATAHAAAGLDIQPGHHFLQASSPQEMADTMVEVLTNGAPELAARGRTLAESSYSVEALTRILAEEPVLEVAS